MLGTIFTYAAAYVGVYYGCVLGYKAATKGLSHTLDFIGNGFSEEGLSEIGKFTVVEKSLTNSDVELNKNLSDILRKKEQKRIIKEMGSLINNKSAKRIEILIAIP